MCVFMSVYLLLSLGHRNQRWPACWLVRECSDRQMICCGLQASGSVKTAVSALVNENILLRGFQQRGISVYQVNLQSFNYQPSPQSPPSPAPALPPPPITILAARKGSGTSPALLPDCPCDLHSSIGRESPADKAPLSEWQHPHPSCSKWFSLPKMSLRSAALWLVNRRTEAGCLTQLPVLCRFPSDGHHPCGRHPCFRAGPHSGRRCIVVVPPAEAPQPGERPAVCSMAAV